MHAAEIAFAVLCNSLWQAPVIALLTWSVLHIARGVSASTRYAAWMLALAASLVVPVATSFITAPGSHAAASTARVPSTVAVVPQEPPAVVTHAASPQTSASAAVAQCVFRRLAFTVPRQYVFGVVGIWAVVALALLARLLLDLMALERLKRDALPLPIEYRDELERWPEAAPPARAVRLCVSNNTEVPVAVGLFDSMILIPSHLLESFSPREIDQIALHELAHLQRADDWSNGLQRLLVALFFFNPAVRWIAERLDLEREVACDDHVVARTREVRPYAKCLAKMAEVTAWPHRALAAPGVFITRKSISVRIEQLLKRTTTDRSRSSPAVLGAGVAATLAFFAVAAIITPVIASPVPVVTQLAGRAEPHSRPVPTLKPRRTVAVVAPSPKRTVVLATPSPKAATPKPAAATPRPQHHTKPRSQRQTPPSSLNCVGCSLAGVNWSGRDLHGMNLRGANLADIDLRNADLHDADLSGANMAGARLAGANLTGTSMRGANLADTSFAGVDLSHADISGANVDARNVDPASLRTLLARCVGCNFADANFRNQNLRGIRVTGVNLANADFRNADISGAQFQGVNFEGAHFEGARMDGTRFTGCNFDRVDMRSANFSRATLTGSDLSGAILQ